jgi:catechol 2,3-dioxygenase-like lactoylglutathione lyase family enzyme
MKKSEFPRMHVSLYVNDIEKTVSFYRSFFEQEPSKVKPGYAKFTLSEPSLIISFVENKDRVQPLFGHLGFQLETEKQMLDRLEKVKQLGFGIKEEIGSNCCYAKQDKFWISDPDGHRWEVYYLHEDVEWNDPEYSETAEACCSPSMLVEPANEKEPCCDPSGGCC